MNEFEVGFYNKLIGIAPLQVKLNGGADKKIYHIVAPQASVKPYIVFGVLTDTPRSHLIDTAHAEVMTFYVNIFTITSPANAQQISDLVSAGLDSQEITIIGYYSMACYREFTSNIIYDPDSKVFQLSMRFRIMGMKS